MKLLRPLFFLAVVLFVIATAFSSPIEDESLMEAQERAMPCKDLKESCKSKSECCKGTQCLCNFAGFDCVCAPEGLKT